MAEGTVGGKFAAWLRERAQKDRNRLSITVVPSQATRVIQLDLPRWSVRLVLALLILGTVLIVGGTILNAVLFGEVERLGRVREENRELQAAVARVAGLEREIEELDQIRRQLYTLAGVDDPVPDPGQLPSSDDEDSEPPAAADARRALMLTEEAWTTPLRVPPARGPVSRGFTMSVHSSPNHSGVDIAGPVGAEIVAAAAGVVVSAGWDSTFGNMMAIRHKRGWETRYGHNEELLVAEGDSVQAGQRIARLGNTGRSSAPHLHFETILDGVAVDPADYFRIYQSGGTERKR